MRTILLLSAGVDHHYLCCLVPRKLEEDRKTERLKTAFVEERAVEMKTNYFIQSIPKGLLKPIALSARFFWRMAYNPIPTRPNRRIPLAVAIPIIAAAFMKFFSCTAAISP